MQTEIVTHELRIDASPETVFEFLTDPELMLRWKGRIVRLDPRVGGEFFIEITPRDIASGSFVEVDPPKRVVFTWGWVGDGHPIPPGSTTVEITLEPDGEGTILHLEHRDLPEGAGAAHDEGWTFFLPRLALAAAGDDPGSYPGKEEAL